MANGHVNPGPVGESHTYFFMYRCHIASHFFTWPPIFFVTYLYSLFFHTAVRFFHIVPLFHMDPIFVTWLPELFQIASRFCVTKLTLFSRHICSFPLFSHSFPFFTLGFPLFSHSFPLFSQSFPLFSHRFPLFCITQLAFHLCLRHITSYLLFSNCTFFSQGFPHVFA